MEKKMFCYQRELTDTAKLQDELTGALIALARAVDGAEIREYPKVCVNLQTDVR